MNAETDTEISSYPLSPHLRARMMGAALGVIGVLLLILTLLIAVLHLSLDLLVLAVAIALVAIFTLGHFLVRRWAVVRLDDTGYRLRFVRGAGVSTARWVDVHDLRTADVGNARCVVLNLRDGRSTTIPVDVVAGGAAALTEDLRARLNKGHGIRPLN